MCPDPQIAAWKAGHKKKCGTVVQGAARGGAARAGATPTRRGMTAEQNSLHTRLSELEGDNDWLGVMALEHEAQALVRELRGTNPGLAGKINSVLGNGFQLTGDYVRSRELHEQHRAICEELGDSAGVAAACCNLGNCYECTGNYGRAGELHQQSRTICEALGDRAGVARACGNLGVCYYRTGDYGRARELHEQRRKMAEEMGDRRGLAVACANLGNCYFSTGEYGRAHELYEQDRAICEQLGDRAGVATACGNLGICYHRTGEYGPARELHEKERAILQAVGDRAGVARACGNLGNCYYSTGDYARALELQEQRRAIAEEIGDRQGVAGACGNIGKCWLNKGDYGKAIWYFTQQSDMAKEIQVVPEQEDAALCMGVALRLEVRANVRGRDASASERAGPPVSSEDRVCEAEKWLQTARDMGRVEACLHLAHLTFDAGQEASALQYLQDYLSSCVERGRNQCAGCDQRRGEDAQMLTCGCCRVARFCSVDHQKMASKSVASGGCLLKGRHRDVCQVLGKWRQHVVKESASPEALREDLLALLRK